jgi:hypothetical protein
MIARQHTAAHGSWNMMTPPVQDENAYSNIVPALAGG